MNQWCLFPVLSASMPFHMALDEILFRRMEDSPSQPLLRFYYASEPWVTVGFSEAPDLKTLEMNGRQIPVCPRITGGGTVLHEKDLIFSLIASKRHDDSFSSVRISYLKIHEAVKAGLEKLGKTARFYRCDEDLPKGKECFKFPIATDLAVSSRKVAGGAQKRSAGALLHQESLQLPDLYESRSLRQAMVEGFEKVFEVAVQNAEISPDLLTQAKSLAPGKYDRREELILSS